MEKATGKEELTDIPIMGTAAFRLRHPHHLRPGNLGFALMVVKSETGEVLLESKGWRIYRGKVYAPTVKMAKTGKWIDTSVATTALLGQILESAKDLWEAKYRDVEFS